MTYFTPDDEKFGYCSAAVITADNNEYPHGVWDVDEVLTTLDWFVADNPGEDFAAAHVEKNDEGDRIADVVGSLGFKFGYGGEWDDVTLLGYPREGDKFSGDDLWYCRGATDPWWVNSELSEAATSCTRRSSRTRRSPSMTECRTCSTPVVNSGQPSVDGCPERVRQTRQPATASGRGTSATWGGVRRSPRPGGRLGTDRWRT